MTAEISDFDFTNARDATTRSRTTKRTRPSSSVSSAFCGRIARARRPPLPTEPVSVGPANVRRGFLPVVRGRITLPGAVRRASNRRGRRIPVRYVPGIHFLLRAARRARRLVVVHTAGHTVAGRKRSLQEKHISGNDARVQDAVRLQDGHTRHKGQREVSDHLQFQGQDAGGVLRAGRHVPGTEAGRSRGRRARHPARADAAFRQQLQRRIDPRESDHLFTTPSSDTVTKPVTDAVHAHTHTHTHIYIYYTYGITSVVLDSRSGQRSQVDSNKTCMCIFLPDTFSTVAVVLHDVFIP